MLLISEAGLTSLCFSEHPQTRGTSSKEIILQWWDFRINEISLPFSNPIRLTAYSALLFIEMRKIILPLIIRP